MRALLLGTFIIYGFKDYPYKINMQFRKHTHCTILCFNPTFGSSNIGQKSFIPQIMHFCSFCILRCIPKFTIPTIPLSH